MPGRSVYRREAILRSAQPEALNDLLRVTAPHERVFVAALLVPLLILLACALLAA